VYTRQLDNRGVTRSIEREWESEHIHAGSEGQVLAIRIGTRARSKVGLIARAIVC
jgi:hypothetical protein